MALALPATAGAGHVLLDHPAPSLGTVGPPPVGVQSGGPGAEWELIETIATGNPHTDLDFFTQGGDVYASVGTLAIGANAGGQTIVQLTQGGTVDPRLVSSHPSAGCLSDPSAALALQHDAEAAPKGEAILNTDNPFAVRSDAQVLLDTSDGPGRCHDQGVLGLVDAPQGGLEIVDITDVANPVEIGLTSHIGEAHTVNVDPKRPHIAYAVTSDTVGFDPETGERSNETSDVLDLDGFEVVDFSSCLGFPPGTSVEQKRAACEPEVYRYRYPTAQMALGHTVQEGSSAIFGCHELEVYPDDRLICGSGNALIALDMSGAFDDMGTPTDFSDDRPRGTPLPCAVRDSTSLDPFATGATVIDCVDPDGDGSNALSIPNWLDSGAPSLEGVEYLGSIYHQGGGPGQGSIPPFDSTEDLAFDHEAELSDSGELLIATDERGGGVVPPGATCLPGADNTAGNGGVHFYRAGAISATPPQSAEEAQGAYARTPDGEKAIYRAPIRTQPHLTVCTAHVFHQIPGENRIFMAWYSQGTQVIDFVEEPDGTVRFADAGHMIPANANEWVSAIFKIEENPDATVTYYGAAADFNLGESGRNTIEVYKVTLPPAPQPLGAGKGGRCAQRIPGTKRGDKLVGSIAGDRINGRGGNDRINGRAGDDCLKGGGGRDRVKGGPGRDRLKGGRGADRLNGGGGRDRIKDRSGGRDRVKGGGGRDVIKVHGGGADVVDCGGGRDRAVVDARDRVRRCERVRIARR